MHGKEKAVAISAEEYERLTGRALIEAMRDPGLPEDFNFERVSVYFPVRDVDRLFDEEK